jgi:hypothetical protein
LAASRRSQTLQNKKAHVACIHEPGQVLAKKRKGPETRRREVLKFVNWYLLFPQPSSQIVKVLMRFHNSSYVRTRRASQASRVKAVTDIQVSRRNEVGLRTRVLECLLDEFFNFVPVVGLDTLNTAVEVLLNLAQHLPFLAVGDEGNGNTDATETTGTTNTVKVRLVVGFTGA